MFLYVPFCKAGDHFASTQVCENVVLSEQIYCLLVFVSDILSEGHRSVLWDGPAQSRDSSHTQETDLTLFPCARLVCGFCLLLLFGFQLTQWIE